LAPETDLRLATAKTALRCAGRLDFPQSFGSLSPFQELGVRGHRSLRVVVVVTTRPTSRSEQRSRRFDTGADRLVVGAEVRWAEGTHELEFPRVPFPSLRIFELAGEPALRALVLRHHQRLHCSALLQG
jgi:hypothetical protein